MSFSHLTSVKADSQINNYILQNRLQPVGIQYRQGTFDVWQGYRYGIGQPEGVIVHETATKNETAEQFVTQFNANWPKAKTYVHAFVDDQSIINIHSTDYLVWGAGPTANHRYIQVELCEMNSYDSFARSLSNDANYIAKKLLQYNLPDVAGETVLSHKETSDLWGETNHSDPTGYFATWGYDMNQFNDLIFTYYNNLKTTGTVFGNNNSSSNNVIHVNNPNGSYVPIVAFNNNGTVTDIKNRALSNNTDWFTDQTKSYNNVNYHRVATNEWVAETYKG